MNGVTSFLSVGFWVQISSKVEPWIWLSELIRTKFVGPFNFLIRNSYIYYRFVIHLAPCICFVFRLSRMSITGSVCQRPLSSILIHAACLHLIRSMYVLVKNSGRSVHACDISN
jgi:hypothetical protein